MDSAAGRCFGPDAGLLTGRGDPVAVLSQVLESLVRERETLRRSGVARDVLDRNRLAIVRGQQEFSRVLIARYGRPHTHSG